MGKYRPKLTNLDEKTTYSDLLLTFSVMAKAVPGMASIDIECRCDLTGNQLALRTRPDDNLNNPDIAS